MDIIIFTCVSGIFFQRSIGAYQLAHFLREHGYTVQVIDFTDHFTTEELVVLSEKFITENTLAIGISTTFYNSTEGTNKKYITNDRNKFDLLDIPSNILETVNAVKKNYPSIKVLAGGAKSEPAQQISCIDTVIHGYAEDKVLDYLNSLPNNKKQVKQNSFLIKPVKESTTPLVIKDDPLVKNFSIETSKHRFIEQDLVLPGETLPLEISRGCIFKCLFCAFPLNGKSKLDYIRDTEQIKDELSYNYENYGTTNYFLSDDTLNDSTYKIEQLHKAITSLPFKIKFTTYLRLDLLYAHQEQVDMLYEMGLASPYFGIESLNQKSASSIGKGMNVNRAKDFLLELHHNRWKEQIPITCSFIVGLPHETKETVRNTYQWIKDSPLNALFFPLSINTNSFYKSEFNTDYKKFGYKMEELTGYWENEHFNYNEAIAISDEFNNELMFKNDYPSSWFLMTLLNHGYTLEEATTTQIKDLNYSKIFKERQRNIKKYKLKINNINTL